MDLYNTFGLVLRLISLLFYASILWFQLDEIRKHDSGIMWVKWVLFGIVVLTITADILAVVFNFFRAPDGNYTVTVRHTSMVINSILILSSALGWFFLYVKGRQKE